MSKNMKGKFEERITKSWRKIQEHGMSIVHLQELNHIIEEARKAFPKITNYKTENYFQLHLKRVDWFMEWFVDSSSMRCVLAE